MTRDCVMCLPVLVQEAPPSVTAIRAVCGVCRSDVWISRMVRDLFNDEPERYVLACLFCVHEIQESLQGDEAPMVFSNIDGDVECVKLVREEDVPIEIREQFYAEMNKRKNARFN